MNEVDTAGFSKEAILALMQDALKAETARADLAEAQLNWVISILRSVGMSPLALHVLHKDDYRAAIDEKMQIDTNKQE